MKQLNMTILLTLLMSIAGMEAWAYDFEVDGIYYNFGSNETEAEVTYNEECVYVGNVVIPESVTFDVEVEDGVFESNTCSVTSIGENAFNGCSSLTGVIIPSSITEIGGSAFQNCSGLKSIIIPNSVTSIGQYTFYGCTSLTSVTLSNSIASIEWGMFAKCTSLKSVTIPYSVTTIWDEAFSDCTSLMSVKVENKTPISIEEETFSNRREITLCVPAGCKSAYQDADNWKQFKYIVEIGDVNGDGKITPADAIMILYAYFGVNQTGFYSVAADLNGDREVTPADAIEALYKYFGDGNSNNGARSTRPTTWNMKDPD